MRSIEADCTGIILKPSTERSGEASRQSIIGFHAEAFLQNMSTMQLPVFVSALYYDIHSY